MICVPVRTLNMTRFLSFCNISRNCTWQFSKPLSYLLAKRRSGPAIDSFGESVPPSPLFHFVSLDNHNPSVQQIDSFLVLPQTIHAWTMSHGTEAEAHQRRLEGCWCSTFPWEINKTRHPAWQCRSACQDRVSVRGLGCRRLDHTMEEWRL